MFDQLAATPDDLDGLSGAVTRRTGVDVEVADTMPRNAKIYWVALRKK
jgi:hypothetical protein